MIDCVTGCVMVGFVVVGCDYFQVLVVVVGRC